MTVVAQKPAQASKQHSAGSFAVAMSLATRSIVNVFRVPGAFVPVIVMPIFFLLSFSGSFSGLARSGILPTRNMLSWVTPYAILQGAAFAGMGATFSVARDLEGGFYDRLLLAPAPRRALVLGPMLSAMIRSLIPVTVVTAVAFVGGARLTSGPWGLIPMIVASIGVAAAACLWGLGIAFRFQSQRSLALVQVGIFSAMFLSASQVPVRAIEGWVQPIARINPISNVLRLSREGFMPGGITWHDTWGGVLAIIVSTALLAIFAVRGMRKVLI
jgi:ABC-2 type transport system permease protein